ncbi:hypothetical protein L1887_07719 [Cichorium endivia]|nr:hypothetical protein L1887_07719 [Cichorium endivia]
MFQMRKANRKLLGGHTRCRSGLDYAKSSLLLRESRWFIQMKGRNEYTAHCVPFRIIRHFSATIDLSSRCCKAFKPSRSQQTDPVVAKNKVRKLLRRALTNSSSSHRRLFFNGRYSFL